MNVNVSELMANLLNDSVTTNNHFISFIHIDDDCPLYFDDGSNPYKSAQDHVTILRPMATNSIRSFLNHHHHHIWLQTFLFISSFLI